MNILKKLLWLFALPFVIQGIAQPMNPQYTDPTAQAVALEPLREADVAYQLTVERTIDTREKQNIAINWPQNALRDIVLRMALTNQLTAYKSLDFGASYASTEIAGIGASCRWLQVICPGSDDPEDLCDTQVCDELDWTKVVKWRVVEQWIFDKEQSRMIPRIVAIAPVYRPVVGGLELPETPVFWIKYDDIREQLAQNKIFNAQNTGAMISYDHFFQARLFSSYITKYPNAFDLPISSMEEFADNSMAALYEAERIKKRLFEIEHDQWEY